MNWNFYISIPVLFNQNGIFKCYSGSGLLEPEFRFSFVIRPKLPFRSDPSRGSGLRQCVLVFFKILAIIKVMYPDIAKYEIPLVVCQVWTGCTFMYELPAQPIYIAALQTPFLVVCNCSGNVRGYPLITLDIEGEGGLSNYIFC